MSILLLRHLLKYPSITSLVHTQIQNHLELYKSTHKWQHKSLALSLIHSLFQTTSSQGALPTQNIDVQSIFDAHVMQDFSSPQGITRYEAVVFVMTFRSLLNCVPLFTGICGMTGDDMHAVRLIACICVDKMFSMVETQSLATHSHQVLEGVFRYLKACDTSSMSENHVMMKVCVRFLDVCSDASRWIPSILDILTSLCRGKYSSFILP